jgi:hypothetical protein
MIKNFLLLFLFFFLFPQESKSQNLLEWVAVQGENSEDINNSIDVDVYGQVYAVGQFRDSLNSLYAYGSSDVVVCKFSSSGVLLWSLQMGGVADDLGNDIELDNHGNLYITGHFRNTFYYGSDSSLSSGNTDVFVAKIDTSGLLLWVKRWGNSGFETADALSCDLQGNVFVGGTFEDSLSVDGNVFNSYGNLNNFIVKLDANAGFIWANSVSTPVFNNIQSLATDDSSNLYIGGFFRDVLYSTAGQMLSNGGKDAFLLKFDVNGTLVWQKKYGGSLDDFGYSVHVDSSLVYLTGVFQDSAFFDTLSMFSAGEYDVFLAQCNLSGIVNWVEQIAGADDSKAYDIETFSDGNVCIAGSFEGKIWNGTDSIGSRNPKHVPSDVFFAEYDINGNFLTLQNIWGGMSDRATGLAIDSNFIYLGGYFQDSVYFDSTTLEISNNMSFDWFLAKYRKTEHTNCFTLNNSGLEARIFPNPVSGFSLLEFFVMDGSHVDVMLVSLNGQTEMLMQCENCPLKNQFYFSKNNRVVGLYFVCIRSKDEQIVLPVIFAN